VRGEGRWAAGPFGPKGKEVRFCFFFSFSNFFLQPLFFSNSNQNSFKLFLKNLLTFQKAHKQPKTMQAN
jgi:hypothetical protein